MKFLLALLLILIALKGNLLWRPEEKSDENCVYFVKTISYHYRTTGDWFYDRYNPIPRGYSEGFGILAETGNFGEKEVMTWATISTKYRIGDFSRRGFEGKRVSVIAVFEDGKFREPTEEEQEGENLKLLSEPLFKQKIEKLQKLFKDLKLPKHLEQFQDIITSIVDLDASRF